MYLCPALAGTRGRVFPEASHLGPAGKIAELTPDMARSRLIHVGPGPGLLRQIPVEIHATSQGF